MKEQFILYPVNTEDQFQAYAIKKSKEHYGQQI